MQTSHQKGFTLIELILVVTIMITIGTLSAVFYSRFITQNNVSNIQEQLLGDLRKAQLYAMMSRDGENWGVRYESNKLILFQGDTYGTRTVARDETFNIPSTITISGFVEITFGRINGIPSNGNPSTTPTITITGNSGISKQITVNSQGVASK